MCPHGGGINNMWMSTIVSNMHYLAGIAPGVHPGASSSPPMCTQGPPHHPQDFQGQLLCTQEFQGQTRCDKIAPSLPEQLTVNLSEVDTSGVYLSLIIELNLEITY